MESSWDHQTSSYVNLKLSIEDQGADYVEVNIKKLKDGIIELSQ